MIEEPHRSLAHDDIGAVVSERRRHALRAAGMGVLWTFCAGLETAA